MRLEAAGRTTTVKQGESLKAAARRLLKRIIRPGRMFEVKDKDEFQLKAFGDTVVGFYLEDNSLDGWVQIKVVDKERQSKGILK